MSDVDLSKTVAAKSDQLNADDLIGGPVTIKITQVRGRDEADQPVAVHYEGDNGKPYLPCKSMRRVMINAWGPHARDYPGRALTLYRDPNVKFGGLEVGGIRISHMSHIDSDKAVAINVTRGKKGLYTVKALKAPAPPAPKPRVTRAEELTEEGVKAVETAVYDDPLAIDMATATGDQIAAWCEAFKAFGLKQKTAEGLIALWKEHFEAHIKPLHETHAAAYDVLDVWMQERVRRLREQAKTSD